MCHLTLSGKDRKVIGGMIVNGRVLRGSYEARLRATGRALSR
jgi:hypothetical protein